MKKQKHIEWKSLQLLNSKGDYCGELVVSEKLFNRIERVVNSLRETSPILHNFKFNESEGIYIGCGDSRSFIVFRHEIMQKNDRFMVVRKDPHGLVKNILLKETAQYQLREFIDPDEVEILVSKYKTPKKPK